MERYNNTLFLNNLSFFFTMSKLTKCTFIATFRNWMVTCWYPPKLFESLQIFTKMVPGTSGSIIINLEWIPIVEMNLNNWRHSVPKRTNCVQYTVAMVYHVFGTEYINIFSIHSNITFQCLALKDWWISKLQLNRDFKSLLNARKGEVVMCTW